MSAFTDNLPILAELLILVVAIGFAIQQIRSINRLQRERTEKEKAEKSSEDRTEDRN